MIIATSCYSGDEWRLVKLLKWMNSMECEPPIFPHTFCILYERKCVMKAWFGELAAKSFQRVEMLPYDDDNVTVTPLIQNKVMRNLVLWMDSKFGCPWFFLDNDSVPLTCDWVKQIETEFLRCNEPFMGHIVEPSGHMTGACAMYPPNLSRHSPAAMTSDSDAQDMLLFKDGVKVHNANHLIHQVWNVDANGNATNGAGVAPTFKSMDDVKRLIPQSTVLFHRCKDGSLIDVLEANR